MSATADLAVHPLADLVPPMTDDEYTRLRDDIAANGLLDPIMVYDGRVLDGRHRLRACRDAGVEPTFTTYAGDSPAQFVLSVNVMRRQLTTSQRAMLATRFLPELTREARERQGRHLRTAERDHNGRAKSVSKDTDLEVKDPGPAYRAAVAAGQAVGAGGITVARAKRVVEQAPDLVDDVIAGRMTVGAAHQETMQREREANGAALTARQLGVAAASNGRAHVTGSGHNSARSVQRIAVMAAGLAPALDALNLPKSCARLTEDERVEALANCKQGLKALNALANMLGR